MKRSLGYLLIIAVFAATIAGCSKEDVEVIEPDSKPAIAFEGVPDPQYTGTWKTEDGISIYTIDKNGTYKLQVKVSVKGQKPMTNNLTGQWGVKGSQLQFKDQSGRVSVYDFNLQGNKLTLTTTGSLKGKTIMDRQP